MRRMKSKQPCSFSFIFVILSRFNSYFSPCGCIGCLYGLHHVDVVANRSIIFQFVQSESLKVHFVFNEIFFYFSRGYMIILTNRHAQDLTVLNFIPARILRESFRTDCNIVFHKNRPPDTLPSGVPLSGSVAKQVKISQLCFFYGSNNPMLTLHSVGGRGALELNLTAIPRTCFDYCSMNSTKSRESFTPASFMAFINASLPSSSASWKALNKRPYNPCERARDSIQRTTSVSVIILLNAFV